ncbi:hypothetical protein DH2020_003725 [Rehmannia glutinosa]|uniref:Uncharacterized protein n=1 Tax=Rehmannia glutinosa TaxID=99300 RepID=A0ABR0XMM1_REHGL
MLRRGHDRGFFSSDDSALTKQILATHAPDIEELNVKPVLSIIEDILRLGKPFTTDASHDEKVVHSFYHDEKVLHNPDHDSEIVKLLAFPINKISYNMQMFCRRRSTLSYHGPPQITLKLPMGCQGGDHLRRFCHQLRRVLASPAPPHQKSTCKNIATLKDLPEMMEHAGEFKKKFEAVLDLLNCVLKVTHCLTEFKELPSAYISHESPEMSAATAHIPTAVYWIIRSLLACASILLNLIGSGHEYITSTAESWEILSLAHKLSVILEHLQRQLGICKDLIGKCSPHDIQPAFDETRVRGSLAPHCRSSNPTVGITEHGILRPKNNNMPWYSVDHPSLVEPVAIRYIREVWKFSHMPMLVVLDPQGKPSNLDALPMMWIWGSNAFPFTKAREGALWGENDWNIELLADSIDPRIPEWGKQGDMPVWRRGHRLDPKIHLVGPSSCQRTKNPLEMLYVGKRNPRDKVRRCHEVIDREQLSHIFSLKDYYDYVWYFWVRLWSMWNSKKHIGMTVENDRIMQEIMDALTFDSSEQGIIILGRIMWIIRTSLWRSWMRRYGGATRAPLQPPDSAGQAGYIPERVVCSECGKTMEKYVMYRCCTD